MSDVLINYEQLVGTPLTKNVEICLFVPVLPSKQSDDLFRTFNANRNFVLLGSWLAVFVRIATALIETALVGRAAVFCYFFH